MPSEPISIGPWMGIDNVHQEDDGVFQPPGELEKRLPALVQAQDVDLNDDGWALIRSPVTAIEELTNGLGGREIAGRLFYQDGPDLVELVAGVPVAVLSGLTQRVSLVAHADALYASDGVTHREIRGEAINTWGLPIPTLTVTLGSGSLAPGSYLVQASFLDARGNEGGTSDIYRIELPVEGGIQVDAALLAEAVALNVYIGSLEQEHTTYVDSVAQESLPWLYSGSPVTALDPPKTEQMQGPVDSLVGICSFRAFLLVWRDNVIFRSEGLEPHLFHPDNILQFEGDVQAVEGMTAGFWVGTSRGLWWVAGDDPDKWIPVRKSPEVVIPGSAQVPGLKFPQLGTDEPIALFASPRHIIVGLANGACLLLKNNVYELPNASRVSFALTSRIGIPQLLIAVED